MKRNKIPLIRTNKSELLITGPLDVVVVVVVLRPVVVLVLAVVDLVDIDVKINRSVLLDNVVEVAA